MNQPEQEIEQSISLAAKYPDVTMCVVFFLIAMGFYCMGALHRMGPVLFWKCAWIHLEHSLARKEDREPRAVDEYARTHNLDKL